MHIYLIRHGQTVANAHKIVSGSQETPLTELGRQQIRFEAEKVQHLGIDLIVCSPMQRAVDTAHIIADALQYPHTKIRIMSELRERGVGKLEGSSYAFNDRLSGNFPETEEVEDIEPLTNFHNRVQHALRELMQTRRHNNVLIVCHMNVGRMLEAVAAGKPPLSMYDMPRFENGQIRRLQ